MLTPDFIADATQTIRSTLCSTMPTAAIASGFLSPVDHSEIVSTYCDEYAPSIAASLAANVTVPALEKWLVATHGVTSPNGMARLMQLELRKRRMRGGEFAAK